MRDHQTFSLATLLNTNHLQPQLYQHMIHQMKSPLQQQSFDLTNDNSRSFDRMPKRPNIPPPPPKSPLAHLQTQNFSKTYQSFSIDLPTRRKGKEMYTDEAAESFVSPLEYEINRRNQPEQGFCGGNFDSILKSDIEMEIQIPVRSKSYKRRPIFDKQGLRIQQDIPHRHYKTLEEAKQKLREIDQPELASFLQLMGSLEQQLVQITNHKSQMEKDLSAIYERLSSQTAYRATVSELSDNNSRILRRLRSRNTGEIIKKVFRKKNQFGSNAGEEHLEKLFSRLNKIEVIISEFIQQKDAVENISIVFDFLNKNFGREPTFIIQLQRLYDSLDIIINTDGLYLIWQNCDRRQLQRNQFIQGLSLNNYVLREESAYEQDLVYKGFSRNESY